MKKKSARKSNNLLFFVFKFITRGREETANLFVSFCKFDAVTTQRSSLGYNTITDVKRLNPSNRIVYIEINHVILRVV